MPAVAVMPVGSPPRMRGKACIADDEARAAGITPACAGKSLELPHPGGVVGDHPRVCGEKLTTFDSGKLIPGSPPRMRGKVQLQPWQPTALGITPAYAGKSGCMPYPASMPQDHPRVCGEK